jgi:hypothetical protein
MVLIGVFGWKMENKVANEKPTNGWVVLGIILAALYFIVSFASDEDNLESAIDDPNSSALAASETPGDSEEPSLAATPSIVEIQKAARHAERTIGALGGAGADFYSQRCQDSLEQKFNGATFDRCYAFDLFAGRMLAETGESSDFPRFAEWNLSSRLVTAAGDDVIDKPALRARGDAVALASIDISVSPEAPPQLALEQDTAPTLESTLADIETAIRPWESQNNTNGTNIVDEIETAPELEPIY